MKSGSQWSFLYKVHTQKVSFPPLYVPSVIPTAKFTDFTS